MPKFCLFDASGYIHRAFHALPPLTTSSGEPVNAIYGFSRMLSKVLREDKPDYVAVCFDTAAPTFRHEQYADYKGTRDEIDTALVSQLPLAYEFAKAWGLPCIRMDGFEADDLLATLARKGRELGWDVLILSGDKDILQLVSDRPSVRVRDEIRRVEYDEAGVRERYGVGPSQVVDVLSLMGDKVDNIPGVPGVGPKTASKLIADNGSLEGLFEKMAGVSDGLRAKIEAGRASLLKNRELIALRTDVPLNFSPDLVTVKEPHPDELGPLLKRLEFRGTLHGVNESQQDASVGLEVNKKRIIRTVFLKSELDSLAEQLRTADRISYDLETDGTNQHECSIVGVSLAIREDEGWYIPVGHRYIGAPAQLSWAEVRPAVKQALENTKAMKCGQNLKFDDTILAREGIEVKGRSFDTMIAAYCLDPSRPSFGLKDLAASVLSEKMTRIQELIGEGKNQKSFAEVPVEDAAPYAAADSEVVLRLTKIFEKQLREQGLDELFEKMEMPLVRVIADMESAGARVDVDYLKSLGTRFQAEGRAIEKEIYALCGEEFLLSSTKQLARILFEKLRLPATKKTKTGYSTDESVLTKLAAEHPVCARILAYRELAKLTSTYVDALVAMVSPRTGRVHTSFQQTGAATGRLSSTEPNLQNIPIRSENGRLVRKAFIPEKGNVLLSADYSQIDLRVLAHMSADPNLVKAFLSGGDIHTATAADVFHVAPEDVTPDMRRNAKAINFGIVYGQQAYGLSQTLGIPQKEAQEFIDRYLERYAGVKAWVESTLAEARKTGVVRTISGRLRKVPEISSTNASIRGFAERVAMNTPIQGSSADIIKAAMVSLWSSMREKNLKARMIIQVHDELLFDVPAGELDALVELAREHMEGAYSLRVPLVVDMKKGNNWNDMEKIKLENAVR